RLLVGVGDPLQHRVQGRRRRRPRLLHGGTVASVPDRVPSGRRSTWSVIAEAVGGGQEAISRTVVGSVVSQVWVVSPSTVQDAASRRDRRTRRGNSRPGCGAPAPPRRSPLPRPDWGGDRDRRRAGSPCGGQGPQGARRPRGAGRSRGTP